MKIFATLIVLSLIGFGAGAQSTITNGGFELWGNTVPTGDTYTEPTNWYSNQSGSSIARLGPETCFQDNSVVHSGSYSVRVETVSYLGLEVINGNVTTGVVNAPTTSKDSGYIGTVNYSTPTDVRHMNFTARPDSLVGWYQYTQGASSEQGKVRAILHINDYYDPETPTNEHPDPTANKIADALFLTPTSNVSTWTRFSVPFTYVSSSSPTYIMINATSSANQATTVSGSKLWLDDIQVVYKASGVSQVSLSAASAHVYTSGKTLSVDFVNGNEGESVISLLDLQGRKVFSSAVTNNRLTTFSLDDLATGIYVYQLTNSDFCKSGKLFLQ